MHPALTTPTVCTSAKEIVMAVNTTGSRKRKVPPIRNHHRPSPLRSLKLSYARRGRTLGLPVIVTGKPPEQTTSTWIPPVPPSSRTTTTAGSAIKFRRLPLMSPRQPLSSMIRLHLSNAVAATRTTMKFAMSPTTSHRATMTPMIVPHDDEDEEVDDDEEDSCSGDDEGLDYRGKDDDDMTEEDRSIDDDDDSEDDNDDASSDSSGDASLCSSTSCTSSASGSRMMGHPTRKRRKLHRVSMASCAPKAVRFNRPFVTAVISVPSHTEYTPQEKKQIWTDLDTLRREAKRNRIEWLWEGCRVDTVVEENEFCRRHVGDDHACGKDDDDSICRNDDVDTTEEIMLHPAHCQRNNKSTGRRGGSHSSCTTSTLK